MAIEFNPRTEPPMASRPSIEGDARDAFDLAKQATVWLVFKRDQINSDARLNADEKKRAITLNRPCLPRWAFGHMPTGHFLEISLRMVAALSVIR